MAVVTGVVIGLILLGLAAVFSVIISFKKKEKVQNKDDEKFVEMKRYLEVGQLQEEEESRLKKEEDRRLKEKKEEEDRRLKEEIRESKRKAEQEARERERNEFIDKYKKITPEEVLLDEKTGYLLKLRILREVYDYRESEADELIKTVDRLRNKAKLKSIKTKVAQNLQEDHGRVPADDANKPIPEDVQLSVWQRDGGKCVKCGSTEDLGFDHIIPLSKGGSNTERNIQLLCEQCHRAKRDTIEGIKNS